MTLANEDGRGLKLKNIDAAMGATMSRTDDISAKLRASARNVGSYIRPKLSAFDRWLTKKIWTNPKPAPPKPRKDKSVDYRSAEQKKAQGFQGSGKVIGFIAVIGGITAFGAPGSAMIGVILFYGAIAAFYYWFKYQPSPRLISATPIPPPELSPPGSGFLRATIARREAVYRQAFERPYTMYEVVCWLTLSEEAKAIVRKDNLFNYDVFRVPYPDETIRYFKEIGLPIQDPFFHHPLREFLSSKPVLLYNLNKINLDSEEALLREGLTNTNNYFKAHSASPSTRSETFEP